MVKSCSLYGSETWVVNKKIEKPLYAMEYFAEEAAY